ncbi:hypothetical protein [Paenibacillus sp. MMS18-CY102]|uniref:hypothetical protein n=1 Tax=Paenibacillus sp. MMS18-CY102 TaxID=2682849 RepID=UPI00136670FC|nr:hypothetical protein [Paenibacillus sp. MMS18-CY102]MWC30130.1 hypothetical protein [Paenibacillus sp. MMS18-CY102]
MPEIKLPFQNPIITTYPQQTNVIAITSMHEAFWPWFHSNFIQLKCSRKPRALDLLIYPDNLQRVCPLLDYQVLNRGSLNQWFPNMIGFIMKCIDDQYYFHATVNSYYIPPAEAYYHKVHRFHEILIFGYDAEAKVLFGADFFHLGKYECKAIPFHEFEDAYYSVDVHNNGNVDTVHFVSTDLNNHLSQIEIIKYNDRSHFHAKQPYELDLGNMIDLLDDYLQASNTSQKFSVFENAADGIYGMQVYGMLLNHLEGVVSGEIEQCDVRSFQILLEHKRCMVLRVQYLIEKGIYNDGKQLLEHLKNIEFMAIKMRNYALKFAFFKNDAQLQQILSELSQLVPLEKETLQQFMEELRAIQHDANQRAALC